MNKRQAEKRVEVSKAQPLTKGRESENVEERYKTDESAGGQSNTEASSGEKDTTHEGSIGSKINEIPKGNEGNTIECLLKHLKLINEKRSRDNHDLKLINEKRSRDNHDLILIDEKCSRDEDDLILINEKLSKENDDLKLTIENLEGRMDELEKN